MIHKGLGRTKRIEENQTEFQKKVLQQYKRERDSFKKLQKETYSKLSQRH